MSIGLPFTRILLDAGKLEFQERWSGLEVAAVGNSSSEVLTGLIGDGIWESELALSDWFGSCIQVMLVGMKRRIQH
jgi:Ca2+/Na+ antiporter